MHAFTPRVSQTASLSLQVVLLSPEAKNPAKHVPRALFASLMAVTVVCAAASMSLSGAMPAADLDSDSAFAEAFRDRGMKTAYKVSAGVVFSVLVGAFFFAGQIGFACWCQR